MADVYSSRYGWYELPILALNHSSQQCPIRLTQHLELLELGYFDPFPVKLHFSKRLVSGTI